MEIRLNKQTLIDYINKYSHMAVEAGDDVELHAYFDGKCAMCREILTEFETDD